MNVTTAKSFAYLAGWNKVASLRSLMIWHWLIAALVCWNLFRVIVKVCSAVHRSPSRSSGLDRSESMLYGGSMGQLNGGGNVYLPDYSVRQLTHLQIIKVTPEPHITFFTITMICEDITVCSCRLGCLPFMYIFGDFNRGSKAISMHLGLTWNEEKGKRNTWPFSWN